MAYIYTRLIVLLPMCCSSTQQIAYCSQNYPVTVALLQGTTELSAELIFINEAKQVCQ